MIRKFAELTKEDVAIAGGKGANLGEMTRAGLAVPPGFVITSDAYRLFMAENGLDGQVSELQEGSRKTTAGQTGGGPDAAGRAAALREHIRAGVLPQELRERILSAYREMGDQVRVAVRSSATAEDLPEASFAGQQETYLNIRGEEALLDKVKDCYASLWGDRAVAYREAQGYSLKEVALSVVVQEMVESEKAGVLFTANPVNGNTEEMQINASYGLGESVVSGRVTADTYICGKEGTVLSSRRGDKKTEIIYRNDGNGSPAGSGAAEETAAAGTVEVPVSEYRRSVLCLSEEEIRGLAAEAVKVETHYGRPMDIEWAIRGGRIYILQARPITTLTEKEEVFGEEKIRAYVMRNKPSKMMRSNFAFLLEKVSAPFYPLDEHLTAAINVQKSVIFAEYGLHIDMQPEIDEEGITYFPNSRKSIDGNIVKLFGGIREMKDYEKCRLEIGRRMDEYRKAVRKLEETDYSAMSAEETGRAVKAAAELVARVAYSRFKYALFPSFFGDKTLSAALKKLDPKLTSFDLYGGLDYKTAVVTREIGELAGTVRENPEMAEAVLQGISYEELRRRFPAICPSLDAFMAENGYKSDFNCYCIYAKSFLEDPDRLLNIVRPLLTAGSFEEENRFPSIMRRLKEKNSPAKYAKLERATELFRDFHLMREDSQYMWEEIFYYIKRMLEHSSVLLCGTGDFREGIAYLFFDEFLTACERGSLSDADREKIARRRANRPMAFRVWNACKAEVFGNAGDVMKGISGSVGEVMGPVRVIRGPAEFSKMQKGDVLVCPYTDPEWTPLFRLASAVVADAGAALSHAAIVAREYGIPAVLGVGFASETLKDGDQVLVNGTAGTVTKLTKQRAE